MMRMDKRKILIRFSLKIELEPVILLYLAGTIILGTVGKAGKVYLFSWAWFS